MKKFFTLLIALTVGLAARAEDGYTEWSPLGTATVNADRDAMDGYASMVGAEFAYTTEVSERHLAENPDTQQFKFAGFLGHCDFIVDVNVSEGICRAAAQITDLVISDDYKFDDGYDYWHFSLSSGQYSPARKILTFSSFWFNVSPAYGLQLASFTVELPGAQAEIDFTVEQTGGGVKSTDKFIKYGIERNGVASVRYAVQRERFTMDQLTAMVKGEAETKEAEGDEFAIDFDACGTYYALLLAYDADGKYMGIYRTVNCLSNLEPAGTWEDVGTAVWHHPFSTEYYLEIDGTLQPDVIADEHLAWPVKLEKRTDLADREIYRVVNPYGADCPLNADIERRLALMNGGEARVNPEDGAYRTDDTFWYVFDATNPKAIKDEQRPNGCNIGNFWGTFFGGPEPEVSGLLDGLLRVNYGRGYGFDLTIEMPGYRGTGTVPMDYAGGDEVCVTVGPNVKRVAYTFLPALTVPADEEIDAAAQMLAEEGDGALSVDCEGNGPVNLPIPAGTERPCVAVVVGFDADGKPFAAATIDVFKNEKLYGSVLSESILGALVNGGLDAAENNVDVEVKTEVGGTQVVCLELPLDANHPHVRTIAAKGVDITVSSERIRIQLKEDANGKYQLVGTPVAMGITIVKNNFGALSLHMWDGERNDGVIKFDGVAVYTSTSGYDCSEPFVLTLGSTIQSSIGDVETATEEAAGSAEYFNLQGVRVSNPRGGLFIERRGGSAKVVKL